MGPILMDLFGMLAATVQLGLVPLVLGVGHVSEMAWLQMCLTPLMSNLGLCSQFVEK